MCHTRKASHTWCLLLLAVLQIPAPSSGVGYRTRPADVAVARGESVVFGCGVAAAYPNLTFTYYGNQHTYNLTCPHGYVEAIPQTLYGQCDTKNGESLATWILSKASSADNGTQVVCRQPNNPDAPAAVLYVYDNSLAILIGCTTGGFLATILVFGLLYIILRRSESFQMCFRGKETEDDLSTIITDY